MNLQFDPYGTASQVQVWHNSITNSGPVIATTLKSTDNNDISYISSCAALVPSIERVLLQDGKNDLKVYYTLTKEEKGYLENLSMHNPIAKTGLLRDIKVIKVDKQPVFNDMKLSKVNVFVIEPQEIDKKDPNFIDQLENSQESYAISACTSLSSVINKIITSDIASQKNICVTVKGGIAKKIYEAMKDSYIEAIDLKFEDVATCLENIINLSIETPSKLQNITKIAIQLKRLCAFYGNNLMYKLFISSFLHTKYFVNSHWKNKLIIAYILSKTDKLSVDITNIIPDVIEAINNSKNSEDLRHIANMLMTNVNELKQVIKDSTNKINHVKIHGHSAMGKKSDLIMVEFVAGNISKEKSGLQEFTSIEPEDNGIQNIMEQI